MRGKTRTGRVHLKYGAGKFRTLHLCFPALSVNKELIVMRYWTERHIIEVIRDEIKRILEKK